MKNGFRPQLIIGLLVAIFFFISFSFRVFLPYDAVFTTDWVKFTSNDAYYHMRIVDNLVHNFPQLMQFDPFLIFPKGTMIGGTHFFDWLLAIVIWIIGLGSPSQHTIDVVGAYFPAVLAALTVVPVFFLGKELFNRWVGLLAAFLIAVLPGEYMGRTILGFTDHHVAEVLFSATAAMFLVMAIKAAGGNQSGREPITFNNLLKPDRKILTRPLVFSLLAGIFLGIYLITWIGALLFVFIFSIYFIVQTIVNHMNSKTSDHLGIIGFVTFLVALIFFLPDSTNTKLSLVMIAALFVPPVMAFSSRYISRWKQVTYFYPAILIAFAAAVIGILYAISPPTVSSLWGYFISVFSPGGSTANTTMEMQPFLSPQGSFTTAVAWGNFTTSFFLIKQWAIPGFGLVSFLILIWLYIKHRGEEENLSLLLIWSLIILITTLVQRRFAYYFAVNIAVLSAYISGQIIWYTGLRKVVANSAPALEAEIAEPAKKQSGSRTSKKPPKKQGIAIYQVTSVLAIIVVFVLVYLFNILKSQETAEAAPYAPSDGWQESLTWMKDNTPEPLGDPKAYYTIYDTSFKYPESAYGVTAWWDYGYWITRIAHRIPSTNPSQEPAPIIDVANLFLSQDEASADAIVEKLKSSYVILDYALITSKLWAVVDWAGQEQNQYYEVYYVIKNGSYVPVQLMKPDFYRTLAVRLYSFNGKAVTETRPMVITYDKKIIDGITYKVVTANKEYSSYKAAQDFISSQESGNYDIVGTSALVSPVQLDAVPNFNLIHSSEYLQSYSQNATIPEIKIFEYVK